MNKLETVQLLQIHRTNLNQKLNYPGWNLWALTVSLAGLFWLSFNIINNSNIEWTNAINLLLFLICAFTSLEISSKLFNIPIRKFDSNDPTHYYSKLGASTLNFQILFHLLIWGSIFYLVNYENYLTAFYKAAFNIIFSLLSFAYLSFIVAFNTQRIPLALNSKRSNKTLKKIFLTSIVILLLLISHGFFKNLPSIELISENTLKIGLLFFGLYFLIKTFIQIKRHTPLIVEIDKLIDDLTFDTITSETAIKKLRLIINGLTFRDIISPQLTELLQLNRNFDEICDKINNISKEFENVYNSENKIDIKKVESIFNSINEQSNLLVQLIRKIEKVSSKITFKLNLFLNDQKETIEYSKVLEEILNANKNNLLKISEVQDSYENIKTDFEEKIEKQHIAEL